jgi:hypothetical protein
MQTVLLGLADAKKVNKHRLSFLKSWAPPAGPTLVHTPRQPGEFSPAPLSREQGNIVQRRRNTSVKSVLSGSIPNSFTAGPTIR